ncbi:hypothetical protein KGM48_03600 [Patescibacteria group bacterium]|nr:hypothetical protein [Patescibacteria group bacterium]
MRTVVIRLASSVIFGLILLALSRPENAEEASMITISIALFSFMIEKIFWLVVSGMRLVRWRRMSVILCFGSAVGGMGAAIGRMITARWNADTLFLNNQLVASYAVFAGMIIAIACAYYDLRDRRLL